MTDISVCTSGATTVNDVNAVATLADELAARAPLDAVQLAALCVYAPFGVAANVLLRIDPAGTDEVFSRLCRRAGTWPRLDALLRLDAVNDERRAVLRSAGMLDGPVASLEVTRQPPLRGPSRSAVLYLPVAHASTIAVFTPEWFDDVVAYATTSLRTPRQWETLAVLSEAGSALSIAEAIDVAARL